MSITLAHYLILAAILFALGVFGIFFNRRNLIALLMSLELILLAVNINFVAFSFWHTVDGLPDSAGQIFVFFILTVAAAEAAIGLAILVLLFRKLNSINVDDVSQLKG
ncbi:NADH-quinone oxidoreductase subunit NuoK [Taylorella equigenitalis]|uniref:NADH-quinone oxidoreductase subunit K n=3 Tax=Taylorella equigenitalis TaxID=29575 RepID=A0A654KHN3_TAYEM|nr:NADH-quinone oxidoreductase subunit NuoK [Taylorella equigenitalis]ADU91978.1 NADH-ubiquinone oxidoreductase chain K [Taylorella equigenitalis MCE9]AFN35541.1 NADH-quinone oxidoreductase subunit K [Taylorella equigenitalis ATCC 35865]ASY30196.1 NADH-quinone oxidoreductase subunit K [Taylorella equigenitalis]ASY37499.1 NADH-quinone oxidoreductase subunit NuoK [Taylorella equigenitalis]ASY38968.1 NADH-quinone oxidoreductase subunit K [Taylorella equigenitalis]